MRRAHSYLVIRVLLLALILPVIAACGGQTPQEVAVTEEPVVETAATDAGSEEPQATTTEPAGEQQPVEEVTEEPQATAVAAGVEDYTTPHPILTDKRVRQAIAYCTNRPQLIESVYPYLSQEEQQKLMMDTFLPQGHWALAPADEITVYPFDPERGQQLLEEAGWTLAEGADVRTNEAGEPLVLKFLSTNAQFRITWATVLEQQLLENCGIQIIRTHAPGSYVFGETTGLTRRDFELAGYAWIGEPDPKGTTLYTCDQIPLPSNNWRGQNYMGWCNEEASRAILASSNTLDREERIEQLAIVQREFTEDMVSLPLLNRLDVAAASNNLLNYKPDSTEYQTWNIYEWQLADGGDTVIIGVTQEPDTLFTVVDSFATTLMLTYLIQTQSSTTVNYTYQADGLKELPTVENGGAKLEQVEVSEGDLVWTVTGEPAELAPGVEVFDAEGEPVVYEDGTLTMNQLAVTFEYVDGITWEDGQPLKQEDFELALKISCDPASGAISLRLCESRQSVDFASDTKYTITYLPGVLWPEYFAWTIGGYYPAHQVLADGRKLADVPASEWATLPEIAETPMSTGPYRIVAWEKGQRMLFEANPYYYRGEPPIKNLIVSFIPDSNQAVAQLLSGTIDVLGNHDLEAGPDVELVLDAAERGEVQAFKITSPTWEHLDMNLYTK